MKGFDFFISGLLVNPPPTSLADLHAAAATAAAPAPAGPATAAAAPAAAAAAAAAAGSIVFRRPSGVWTPLPLQHKCAIIDWYAAAAAAAVAAGY